MEEKRYHSHRKPGVVLGFLLVLLGALFLAFNFGVLGGMWKPVVFSWQMLLIVVGLVSLLHRHLFNGLTLMSIGFFFLLPRLAGALPDVFGWAAVGFTQTYWPVLLIVAGVLILLNIMLRPKKCPPHYHTDAMVAVHHRKRQPRVEYSRRSAFDRSSVFGNVSEIILDPVFTGGEMNAVFGNIMLDLRKTTIPEGETEIELNAVFGGITIFVPLDWKVELHLDSVFGGFNDSRIQSVSDSESNRKLIIYGSCVFGGGEVKN